MNKTKLLKAGLMVMMIASLGIYIHQTNQAKQSRNAYENAQQIAQIETTAAPAAETTEAVSETEPQETKEVIYKVWRETEITDDPYLEELKNTNLAALR